MLMRSPDFAHLASDPVACYGLPVSARREAHLDPRIRSCIFTRYAAIHQPDAAGRNALDRGQAAVKQRLDQPATLQPHLSRKALRRCLVHVLFADEAVADGKAAASLATSTRQEVAPVLVGHASAKAMLVAPLASTRLVCSFHKTGVLAGWRPYKAA